MHRIVLPTTFTRVLSTASTIGVSVSTRSITTHKTQRHQSSPHKNSTNDHSTRTHKRKKISKSSKSSRANDVAHLTTLTSPSQIEDELFKANLVFFEARRKMFVHEEKMKRAHELVVTSKLHLAVAQAAVDLDLFA